MLSPEDLMIDQLRIDPVERQHQGQRVHAWLFLAGLLLFPLVSLGADSGSAAGRSLTESGLLLGRPGAGADWQVIPPRQALPAEELLIGITGAQLDSANGAVGVSFIGNLGGLSKFPIIESAVILHTPKKADFDFSLDRGRVEVTNKKESGAAQVRAHVRDAVWDLTLNEPGATVLFELYGRWPRGVPFSKKPDGRNAPTADLLILVAKGTISLKHKGVEHAMSAPPGAALVEWDSVSGQDEAPQHLDKLPPWATLDAAETADFEQKKAIRNKMRDALASKGVDTALEDFLNSNDPLERKYAVYALAALDKLARLGQAVRETKHQDVWEDAVIALRHWIGRGPGQDQVLYNRLIEKANYKPVQAETVLQLLHSFGDEQLARPETYQALIDYLDHDLLAIRGLAYWHLYRLVPEGRELGYNPLEARDAREAAIANWRKLIPPGQVPNHGKAGAAQ
jgi:hypothetical protein